MSDTKQNRQSESAKSAVKPIAKINIGAARRAKGARLGIGWRTAGWAFW